jgi:hypothetical protein
MKRFCSVWLVVVLGIAGSAAAQPAASEPATAPFLEKRVPEELATEGVVLSRNNLGLKLEQVGEKWLVSLIDLGTDRVAASTKIDVLPPDREAAVAAMTHVVADLATQIVGHVERPAPAPPPALPQPDATAAHDQAELTFHREAIRFSNALVIGNGTITPVSSGRGWRAYQGDLDEELKPRAFYTAVGRPDLIPAYDHRRNLMIAGFTVCALGVGTALATIVLNTDPSSKHFRTGITVGSAALLVGVVGGFWGGHYLGAPHPIDVSEAKRLADAYNQGLRRQLRLPIAARRPALRDVTLAPFVGRDQGGVAMAARF